MNLNDHPYLFLAIFLVMAAMFALVPLLLAQFWARCLSPPKHGGTKHATYECGLESKGDAHVQFNPRYYLYGIVFLIFDVELLFLLPFAVAFPKLPAGALMAMVIFLTLVIEGWLWAWAKGILKWQ